MENLIQSDDKTDEISADQKHQVERILIALTNYLKRYEIHHDHAQHFEGYNKMQALTFKLAKFKISNILRQFEGQYDCVDNLKIDIKEQF